MNKQILLLSGVLLSGFYHHSYAEPQNLHQFRKTLIQYHDSGDYIKEISTVAQKARDYLTHRLTKKQSTKSNPKLAVVFDIDETVLSNYKAMVKPQFGGSLKHIEEEVKKGQGLPIKPMQDLYHFVVKNKVAVFFVTGRHEDERLVTEQNLKKAGFNQWQALYLKPQQYVKKASAIPYKSAMRKAITEKGYTIVASIGDQKSDYLGGYTEKGFKLPNPYYYIP